MAQPNSFAGHSKGVYGVVHDAANQQIVSCGHDGSAVLWSEDGRELQRCLCLTFPNSVVFSFSLPDPTNPTSSPSPFQVVRCRSAGQYSQK